MPKSLMPAGLSYLTSNIMKKDNILGAGRSKKSEWAKGLTFARNTGTIFFAGCGYQYNYDLESIMNLLRTMDRSFISTECTMRLANGLREKLKIDAAGMYRGLVSRSKKGNQPLEAAVRVLGKLGIEFGYLGEEEPCCGGAIYFSGLHRKFQDHIMNVRKRLRSVEVKQIISIVPSCTYTLKTLLPQATGDNDVEVKHFCEVVSERISGLNLVFPEEKKVTYHDPCQMVRYLGLVEEPRLILKSIRGITFVEPAWTTGLWATCCGGGGGFEAVFPELSLTLAKNRVRELVDTGADIIVTHCPGCLMQLEAGLKELKIDHVRVMDLSQIIAISMGVM